MNGRWCDLRRSQGLGAGEPEGAVRGGGIGFLPVLKLNTSIL